MSSKGFWILYAPSAKGPEPSRKGEELREREHATPKEALLPSVRSTKSLVPGKQAHGGAASWHCDLMRAESVKQRWYSGTL